MLPGIDRDYIIVTSMYYPYLVTIDILNSLY